MSNKVFFAMCAALILMSASMLWATYHGLGEFRAEVMVVAR